MTYLFDASSIVNLVKRNLPTLLSEGATLNLAVYESLNAIWKEHVSLKRIDEDTATALVKTLKNIFDVVKTLPIVDLEEVFTFASKEGLSIYDASYAYTALKNGLILVTDDQDLRDKVSKNVKAISTEELVKQRRT